MNSAANVNLKLHIQPPQKHWAQAQTVAGPLGLNILQTTGSLYSITPQQSQALYGWNITLGICAGATHLFARILFDTLGAPFANVREHLIAISQLFWNHAPIQAVALQQELPVTRCGQIGMNLNYAPVAMLYNPDLATVAQNIDKVGAGLYSVSMYANYRLGHEVLWVHREQGPDYIFDANVGLIECNEPPATFLHRFSHLYWDHLASKRTWWDWITDVLRGNYICRGLRIAEIEKPLDKHLNVEIST